MTEDSLVYQGIQAEVKDGNGELSQMPWPDLVKHNELNYVFQDKIRLIDSWNQKCDSGAFMAEAMLRVTNEVFRL